ncbi:tetratricopeptide repeat protein [Paenarthrobacter sp. JL.01a]|uniref:tetratricopeptide repeat protein n=1 Tax=Paenarthrobacter sp. JL.01a TaxID=2979324 RepID=UPI0021C67D1D|nr:tetratricopeptide repeat protein [Paenarthrobacter sp. JL.01a]UXM92233.1 tetratricopeptide repeat protein [Paenarthrobacter sp. JL.01a]
MNSAAIDGLLAALERVPDNVPLRINVAKLLLQAGRHSEAIDHLNIILEVDAANTETIQLLVDASAGLSSVTGAGHGIPEPGEAPGKQASRDFDWHRAEQELGQSLPAPFVSDESHPGPPALAIDGDRAGGALFDVDRPAITLADVGGLEEVKKRLNESFLDPMRNPEVAKAFGKSLRGGLLLYGPPGCGKTFMARAVAGELGAAFMTATMTDIFDKFIGETEKNLHEIFEAARRAAPAVLFLDEIDAVATKRSALSGGAAWMRQTVNQLLLELDSMDSQNDGLFVLAATNQPWDIDNALLRPGRLDRMLLVLPPDRAAREAILKHHFSSRPIAGIDVQKIASRTEDFSGADLEHVVTSAAEKAMTESLRRGSVQAISMSHVNEALKEIRPSTRQWLQMARNVVEFGNTSGAYDDLGLYLRFRKMI